MLWARIEFSESRTMAKETLLIVEDDQTSVHILGAMLRDYEFDVAWGKNIEEALSLSKSRRIALVLCDQWLEEERGTEFVRLMRELDDHANTPVIMMTSTADQDVVKEAKSLKISDFIVKPIEPMRLRKAIAKAISFRV